MGLSNRIVLQRASLSGMTPHEAMVLLCIVCSDPFGPAMRGKRPPAVNSLARDLLAMERRCGSPPLELFLRKRWRGKQRERAGHLCPSEMMTILIHFHLQTYAASRDCKRLFQSLRSFQNPFSAQQCSAVTYDAILLRTRTSAHS